jgi:serine/threonine protein kinase
VLTPDIQAAVEGSGKFQILEQFTEGQSAYSFKAHHLHLNREVFLKLYDYSDNMANDVLREPRTIVEAMRMFRSENVVELFDAEVLEVGDDKYLCLQMEFVKGESLLSLMRKGAIGQQDAVRLTAGVLNGLAHLHSRRILHRDIKPANIVVAASGVPKLTDFGSVALLPEGQVTVTASKHSALYVPPEASASQVGYTFESDLYQVGMVLYELINGPLRYDLQHYLSPRWLKLLRRAGIVFNLDDECDLSQAADAVIGWLAEKQQLLEYGRPAQPYFSSQLRKIVTKACKPKPADRFGSAQGFCTRLMQVNVPNWRTFDEHVVRASQWKGWDWEVANVSGLVVKKSRPNRNAYRRIPNRQFLQLGDAFEFVESI